MLNTSKLFIIFSSYFITPTYSFELGLWRGSTHFYTRNYKNQFDFTKPIVTTYNYSHNFNTSIDKVYYHTTTDNLKIKLESYEKTGGVIVNANMDTNRTHFNSQINFIHKSSRSIANVNYYCGKDNKLKLNYISVSGLRCGLVRTPKIRVRVKSIDNLIATLKTWGYCKTTSINSRNIYASRISESDSFDFEYLMTKTGYISNVFIDNLVISIPDVIEEDKPFSLLFGCLVSEECYKQITLNYNFRGCLVSTEFNEYEPYNLSKNINRLLDFVLFNLRLKNLGNKTT